MRLFTAIELPPSVRAALHEAVAPLRARRPTLRWSPETAWHLTLAFHGEIPERRLIDLQRRLGQAAQSHPVMRLQLAGAGHFRRQVLWARCVGDVDAAAALAASVRGAGRCVGGQDAEAERSRSFTAHVTLARAAKRSSGRELQAAATDLEALSSPSWTAADIVLLRSEPGAGSDGRSRYTELGRYALA